MHLDANFRNGSGAATKWRETIQKLSFRLKVVDWVCLLQKKQETVLEAQTHALNVPRYRFCNVSSAATKWHGTTQNMSFGLK